MAMIGISNDVDEKRTKSYIKPTDSDYVKLAKQGGDKDLLVSQAVTKSEQPQPYSKCDWFDHIHNDEEDARNRKTSNQMEDKKVHDAQEKGNSISARKEGSMIKEKYTTGGVPYHTDNMSFWERKQNDTETPAEGRQRRARNPIS